MAKKVAKKDKNPQDFEAFMASMRKNNSFLDLTNKEEEFYRFGDFDLDRALGGGLPKKHIYSFQGAAGSGKTLASAVICREVIRQGGRVLYFDVENKFSVKAQKKFSLYGNPNFQIFSVETQEDAIASMIEIIESGFFQLIVIDSVDALLPEEQKERGVHEGTKVGGFQAKNWSEWLRSLPFLTEKYDCSVIMIRQVRDNPGNPYAGEAVSGGRAIEFYSAVTLGFSKNKAENIEQDGRVVYQGGKIRLLKTNQGASPKDPIEVTYYIGDDGPWGFDEIGSTFREAVRLGIFAPRKAGSPNYAPCKELCEILGVDADLLTYRGKANAQQKLREDEVFFNAVHDLCLKYNEEGKDGWEHTDLAVEEVELADDEEEMAVDFEDLDD